MSKSPIIMNKARNKKLKDNAKQKYILNKTNLTLSDVICPICLNIMIEPITMPCNHCLCLCCFKGSISQTSLNCPICRKRISTWVRKYPNYGNLVDQELWLLIKEKFPKKVAAKLENKDDSQENIPAASPRISAPGEIRKEYQKELETIHAELQSMKQKEHDASIKVIAKIVEEENILNENAIEEVKNVCKKDMELAKEIRQNQISERLANLKCTPKSLPFSPITKPKTTTLDKYLEKSPTNYGHLGAGFLKLTSTPKESEIYDKYIPSKRRPLYSENSIGNNSLLEADSLFSNNNRLDAEALNFSGFSEENSQSCVSQSTPVMSLYLSASTDGTSTAMMSMEAGNLNLGKPAKNCEELDQSEGRDLNITLSSQYSPSSGVSAVFQHLNMHDDEIKDIIAQQKSYDDRKKQEQDDRRLAIQLEREFKFVNRRKGTENEYSLRKSAKSSGKSLTKKRNRSLSQSSILDSFAKRQKRS